MTGARVPPARPPVPAWDDATLDAIALTEACAADDVAGMAAVLANCSLPEVAVCFAKVMAEAWGECVPLGHFREYALAAVDFRS